MDQREAGEFSTDCDGSDVERRIVGGGARIGCAGAAGTTRDRLAGRHDTGRGPGSSTSCSLPPAPSLHHLQLHLTRSNEPETPPSSGSLPHTPQYAHVCFVRSQSPPTTGTNPSRRPSHLKVQTKHTCESQPPRGDALATEAGPRQSVRCGPNDDSQSHQLSTGLWRARRLGYKIHAFTPLPFRTPGRAGL